MQATRFGVAPPSFLFGPAQFVKLLQVEAEFGAGAEEVAEAKGGISGDGTLAVENLGGPVGGHLDLPGEFGGAHVQRFELFGELFAGVDGGMRAMMLLGSLGLPREATCRFIETAHWRP